MIGLTDHERTLAIARGAPGTAFAIALAEVSMYFDNHENGRPQAGDAVLNIKVKGTGDVEKIAGVSGVARWLGVNMEFRNGTYFAQRRWGTGGESVLVEAHFTPDHDAAFAMLQQAQDRGAA